MGLVQETRSATAMADQVRAQLRFIRKRLDAADRRGAHYAEVYGLVLLENRWQAELDRLEGKEPVEVGQ